ncbi:uncharacterized protein LOC143431169 [Xylocopa sonorina]|uniref:uncharacterized protein LOC143431169 n=1 Tax=Xylocopa sonorina TaxID=1818115 RepID=UPI00403AF697
MYIHLTVRILCRLRSSIFCLIRVGLFYVSETTEEAKTFGGCNSFRIALHRDLLEKKGLPRSTHLHVGSIYVAVVKRGLGCGTKVDVGSHAMLTIQRRSRIFTRTPYQVRRDYSSYWCNRIALRLEVSTIERKVSMIRRCLSLQPS